MLGVVEHEKPESYPDLRFLCCLLLIFRHSFILPATAVFTTTNEELAMSSINRRRFIKRATSASATFVATTAVVGTRAAPPSETINLAVIGVRGRGSQLAQDFAARSDCRVTYLCDVDQSLLADRAAAVNAKQSHVSQTVDDFRRALDDSDVDAVIVATPDHWHALATVWAAEAGKDVYVEKPISHSPWEGRQMVNAASRYQRVIQVGTQNRSAPYNMKAREYIKSGKLGTVHMVKVFNQKHWPNRAAEADGATPAALDWDMWCGPAPERPYNPVDHGSWNHFWRYSGGDIINDGVHQLDLARYLIGKHYPKSVYSTGGRYADEGVLETPDTQVAVYQFDDLVMTFELTLYTPYMLKTDGELRNSDMIPYWPQNATRIEIYGTKGVMFVGRHGGGWEVYDRPHSRQPVLVHREYGRFPDPEHQQNFIDCIKTRGEPNAPIEQGHLSTLLCQYANVSYRLGGAQLRVDAETETFVDNDAANGMLKREYRAPWVVPSVEA